VDLIVRVRRQMVAADRETDFSPYAAKVHATHGELDGVASLASEPDLAAGRRVAQRVVEQGPCSR
jgi:hypothetical protein